jgi:DNA polymerase-3 subunit gamma/tau
VLKQNYEPLFLKYRPQKLSDVLGQESVKNTLINAINNQKIVHAYLLTGPRGSGKTSSARIIAKSLNCSEPLDAKSPTTQPCGKCDSCISISNSNSIDVTEIDAASHGHVEDARKLIERVNMASLGGKYRIYIIDEVHMLSTAAFNALLKVVEEPPEKVVFIMATTELDKVPKTIISRCQQLRFKPITPEDSLQRLIYVANLEKINIAEDALKIIARHADGAMRDALSLLDQVGVFSNPESQIDEEVILNLLGAISQNTLERITMGIFERNHKALLETIEEALTQGKDAINICQELQDYLLKLLQAINSGEQHNLKNIISEQKIENFEIVQIIDSLAELEYKLRQSSKSKSLLRAWFVKIAHRQDILVIKDLMTRLERLESGTKEIIPIKPFVDTAVPKPESIAKQTSTAVVNQNNNQGYMEYLSPGTRGMFVSSQAKLATINNSSAVFFIPEKFKFLQDKLQARSPEIIQALIKDTAEDVSNISFQIDNNPNAESIKETVAAHTSETSIEATIQVSKGNNKLEEISGAFKDVFSGKEINS